MAGPGAAPVRRRQWRWQWPRSRPAAVLVAGACAVLCGLGPIGLAPIALGQSPASPAPPVPPAPAHWVTDEAGFLSPGVGAALDARLRDYQARTGHQVVMWIGGSTGGVPIEDFTVRAFTAWKVGRKGLDDGLAIFLFALDRKVRFEVGYGLEGQVPDAIASRIIREVMVPRLKAGDHDGAVTHGVEATLAVVDGQPWSAIEAQAATGTDLGATAGTPGAASPQEQAPAARGARRQPVQHGLLFLIFKWILIAAAILFLITHPSLALWLLMSFSG
ncbi:MAG TPA: TPM domain-containing protein, partial [Thermoanaerobaculia bacterium]|nr:TPM domain-containing protein [Thermoanaerobaculia bacterium]